MLRILRRLYDLGSGLELRCICTCSVNDLSIQHEVLVIDRDIVVSKLKRLGTFPGFEERLVMFRTGIRNPERQWNTVAIVEYLSDVQLELEHSKLTRLRLD